MKIRQVQLEDFNPPRNELFNWILIAFTMSGDEADESSVGDTSSEEEDIPLPVSPFKSGTDEPFKVVFKGGSPWGFDLKGGTESKAPLQVSQVTESL